MTVQRGVSMPLQILYLSMLLVGIYLAYFFGTLFFSDGLKGLYGESGIFNRTWFESNIYLMTYSSQTKNLYANYNDVETYMFSLGMARRTVEIMPYAFGSAFSFLIVSGLVSKGYFQVWFSYVFILMGVAGLLFF